MGITNHLVSLHKKLHYRLSEEKVWYHLKVTLNEVFNMSIEEAKKYLNLLLDHIFEIMFTHGLGQGHVDHIFVRILKLLENDEGVRKYFLDCAKNQILMGYMDMTQVDSRPNSFIDEDLILFLAHATRWDTFKEIAKQRESLIDKTDLSYMKDISYAILNALEDDWEDAVFYEYFDSSNSKV